jgi:hypothetical protein
VPELGKPGSSATVSFFQTVTMPETMGMVTRVEAPLGRGRRGCLGLLHGVFHPLDRCGTDRQLRDVLEFPSQAFRAKPRFGLEKAMGLLFHCPREAPSGSTGGRPFGQAGQLVAVPEALDGAGRRRRWTGLGVELGCTPRRMALRQGDQRRFLGASGDPSGPPGGPSARGGAIYIRHSDRCRSVQ